MLLNLIVLTSAISLVYCGKKDRVKPASISKNGDMNIEPITSINRDNINQPITSQPITSINGDSNNEPITLQTGLSKYLPFNIKLHRLYDHRPLIDHVSHLDPRNPISIEKAAYLNRETHKLLGVLADDNGYSLPGSAHRLARDLTIKDLHRKIAEKYNKKENMVGSNNSGTEQRERLESISESKSDDVDTRIANDYQYQPKVKQSTIISDHSEISIPESKSDDADDFKTKARSGIYSFDEKEDVPLNVEPKIEQPFYLPSSKSSSQNSAILSRSNSVESKEDRRFEKLENFNDRAGRTSIIGGGLDRYYDFEGSAHDSSFSFKEGQSPLSQLRIASIGSLPNNYRSYVEREGSPINHSLYSPVNSNRPSSVGSSSSSDYEGSIHSISSFINKLPVGASKLHADAPSLSNGRFFNVKDSTNGAGDGYVKELYKYYDENDAFEGSADDTNQLKHSSIFSPRVSSLRSSRNAPLFIKALILLGKIKMDPTFDNLRKANAAAKNSPKGDEEAKKSSIYNLRKANAAAKNSPKGDEEAKKSSIYSGGKQFKDEGYVKDVANHFRALHLAALHEANLPQRRKVVKKMVAELKLES